MEGEEAAAGRAKVRDLLVDRANAAGLVRRKGVTDAAHAALIDRLCGQLAYMTPDNLRTLAELVIDAGDGPGRTWWPAETTVRGLAEALQARPLAQHRIVSSWLASVEGPVAEAGGWLVELYRFLRQHKRPPFAWDRRRLREEAAENNRRHGLLCDRVNRNAAVAEDRAWMASYAEDAREARAIVDAGRAARAAKAAGSGDEHAA
jgi:hypothetical protein